MHHRQLIDAKKQELTRLEAKLERVVAEYAQADLSAIATETEQMIAAEEQKAAARNMQAKATYASLHEKLALVPEAIPTTVSPEQM